MSILAVFLPFSFSTMFSLAQHCQNIWSHPHQILVVPCGLMQGTKKSPFSFWKVVQIGLLFFLSSGAWDWVDMTAVTSFLGISYITWLLQWCQKWDKTFPRSLTSWKYEDLVCVVALSRRADPWMTSRIQIPSADLVSFPDVRHPALKTRLTYQSCVAVSSNCWRPVAVCDHMITLLFNFS